MQAFEAQQVGKRESLADIISNIVAEETPLSSMLDKRKKPTQVEHSWQVKTYPRTGHAGVVDGKDATQADSNPRDRIYMRGQKTWRLPGVSDFADEATIAGLEKGEMAEQVADAIVLVKHQIERRVGSNEDAKADNGTTQGNETRGLFSWISDAAQTLYPVPEGYRTPTASIYSGTLANFSETVFRALAASSYKQRRGTFKMDAFLGVDLKGVFTDFSKYTDNIAGKTPARLFNQDADSQALIAVVDKLVMDTGEVDLHLSAYLWTSAADGSDTAYTHKSGLVLDMNKIGLAYTRLPRVVKLPYQGGGQKAIVDAIFMSMCDNPLGHIAMKIQS